MRIIIIGGGPGGYTAAFDAADRGHEVILLEKDRIGGTCLNHGCIPTKTMRATVDALELARRLPEFGITGCQDAAPSLPDIRKRVEKVTNILGEGLMKSCNAHNIKFIHGTGTIAGSRHVKVCRKDGSGEDILEGDAIIIATGSKILEIPALPFDHEVICDSNDALELRRIPRQLCIVGGGVIGCELASIYKAFGSNVTIIEGQDRLLPLPSVDADVSDLLLREMKKRKIRVLTGKTLANVAVSDGMACGAIVASPFAPPVPDRGEERIEADMIIVAIGRKPSGEVLGESDINTGQRGWVEVDKKMSTNMPGVYAIGDILGPGHVMLAHVAAMEALCAVSNICGQKWEMDYSVVPSAVFTSPEIGVVGLTEAEAREKTEHVVCATIQIRELGKAQAMSELPGFFKLIANGESGLLLGAQIVGAHASDIVAEASLAIRSGLSVFDMARTIHPHPTLSEGLYEAARKVSAQIS